MTSFTNADADATITRAVAGIHRRSPQAAANLEYDLARIDFVSEVVPFDPTGASFIARKRNGEEIAFNSALTRDQLRRGLHIIWNDRNNEFAASLLRNVDNLSPKQEPWAHYIVNDYIKSQSQPAANDSAENDHVFAAIAAALAAVKGRSKFIVVSDTVSLHLARCKTKVWVKNPSKSEIDSWGRTSAEFIGTISQDRGISPKIPDDVKDAIVKFADSI